MPKKEGLTTTGQGFFGKPPAKAAVKTGGIKWLSTDLKEMQEKYANTARERRGKKNCEQLEKPFSFMLDQLFELL